MEGDDDDGDEVGMGGNKDVGSDESGSEEGSEEDDNKSDGE